MSRKYELISELYDRTCKTVVSNPQNWQNFLQSACRNYKLRYDEQLLIYAQRPDATAVLEIERWNKSFGRWVNKGANISAFSDDSSFALLSALEVINENGELERKADMFFKRTIKPHKSIEKVDTASEALAVSMGEKAGIDMAYMSRLTGKNEETLYQDLKGVIFLNPLHGYGNVTEAKYLMADEYLSGNVREKLITARKSAEIYPEDYKINVEALEKVQPKDLTASEISVRLGAKRTFDLQAVSAGGTA